MNDFNSYPTYCEHRMYSNGDQIWLKHDDILSATKVVKVLTHDGLTWEEGGKLSKLSGYELKWHQSEMYWHRFKQQL